MWGIVSAVSYLCVFILFVPVAGRLILLLSGKIGLYAAISAPDVIVFLFAWIGILISDFKEKDQDNQNILKSGELNLESQEATQFEEVSQFQLTDEMYEALEAVLDGRNVFIQGGAGTGKSTFIDYLERSFKEENPKKGVARVAPTGIAAQNIGGATINSFFGISFEKDEDWIYTLDNCWGGRHYKSKVELLEQIHLVILDEVSMVRADKFDCIVGLLKSYSPEFQLVIVGDMQQLPPVAQEELLPKGAFQDDVYSSTYATDSHCFDELNFKKVYFTRNFRQNEARFMKMVEQLRFCDISSELLASLNERAIQNTGTPEHPPLVLTAKNKVANRTNDEYSRLIPNKKNYEAKFPTFLNASVDGAKPQKVYGQASDEDIRAIHNSNPRPALNITLGVGSRVLFTENNVPLWVNGSLGTVIACEDDSIYVRLDEGGDRDIVTVGRVLYKQVTYHNDYVAGRAKKYFRYYEQFPLMLAWAITIHKAQGLSLDSVEIDLSSGTFVKEQFYVAVSRCRRFGGLYFTHPVTEDDILGRSSQKKDTYENKSDKFIEA